MTNVTDTLTQPDHVHDVHHICDDNKCHHDAQASVKQRLDQAKQYCKENGLRFTQLREQVYKLVLEADKPIGAYDLLGIMQEKNILATNKTNNKANSKAKTIAPPTVYRSLDFLLEVGFIHQLASINAFVPCCHPREKHIAAFLICSNCQTVQECNNKAVRQLMDSTKKEIGFAVETSTIEMTGLCQKCQR